MSASDVERLVPAYISVFADSPEWREHMKCVNRVNLDGDECGAAYHRDDIAALGRQDGIITHNLELLTAPTPWSQQDANHVFPIVTGVLCGTGLPALPDGSARPSCGRALALAPFYTVEGTTHIIEEALRKPGFIGNVLDVNGEVLGFSWGYAVPQEATHSVRFDLLNADLERLGIRPNATFYAAEVAVRQTAQGNGWGREISKDRLAAAAKQGFEGALYRTQNPRVHSIYHALFGGKLRALDIKDPIPNRASTRWTYVSLGDFVGA